MKPVLALSAAAALVLVAACERSEPEPAPAAGEAEAPDDAAQGRPSAAAIAAVMHDRHERYEEMGKAMKGIGRELKAGAPSVEAIRRHAALIAGYGPQLVTWFPEGSGPETGRETRAKAEIWSDPETFRRRALAFEAESAEFERIAQGGDVAAIRAAAEDLGAACRNCHDRFRAPEED